MTRMSRIFGVAALGLMIASSGCVTQEKYNALKLDRDALAEQLARAQNEASSSRAQADALEGQLAQIMQNGGSTTALLENFRSQNAALQAQLDDLNRRYQEAMNRPANSVVLPAELNNELTTLAQQNSDLVEFDASRGMVKFKSDVTFASGDAQLMSKAQDVINRFAQILNSPVAAKYDLLVAGHTDNTRVSNPETIRKGHKNNWYLSSHRAISVGDALQSQRVNPQRIGVVGYADQRPVASNNTDAGRGQNRRVEVLILPTQAKNFTASNAPANDGNRADGNAGLNKDTPTATINPSGGLNK